MIIAIVSLHLLRSIGVRITQILISDILDRIKNTRRGDHVITISQFFINLYMHLKMSALY